ncbi:MAG: polysaccharide deacetylase family protein, partial [Chloroflexi bacterium]|nr:polysaccharide deacetylase family protein [Chloroflexota bacterium]
MVETVQRAALVAAYASGLVWMLLRRRLRGSSLTIFFYQGVSRLEAGDFGPARRRFVTPENFRQQVRFFKKHFTPVLLRDGVAWLEGGPKEGRPMASIVFHDGYRNIFTEAFPTLEAEGVPFTVCCTSGLIGNEQTPWWERLEQAIRACNQAMTLRYGSGERRYDLRTARGKWRLYQHACKAAEEIPSGHPDEVVDDLVRQMGVPASERPGDAFMNWQEVGILGRHPLVELGSHAVNHWVTLRL